MKIIKRENLSQEELTKKSDSLQIALPDKFTAEEAKEKNLTFYVNTDFKQVIGKKEYDFVILKVISRRLFNEHEEITGRIFIVTLWTNEELIEAEMFQEEFSNEKWLKELHTFSFLSMPRRDYLTLTQNLHPKDDKLFYFDRIGIHKLEGKYYYAASNCAVTSDGIKWNIRSVQEGFNLNLSSSEKISIIEKNKIITSFMKYTGWAYNTFYPIHCIPILSILQYFLKQQGTPAGAVLWIDGEIGSGKTQLSITMGDFFNRGSSQGLSSHLNSPKAKYREITKNLPLYRNAVFILDDIKKEESSKNRENSKNITDFLIRSIYKGKIDSPDIEGESVDASAIITGEFFKEQTSTVSRVLYLQINNFLNDQTNSHHFYEIQNNPYYLSDFIYIFLIWLLGKMENKKEEENLYLNLEKLKEQASLNRLFHGQAMGSRMIETVANFQIVSVVLDAFFKDNGIGKERRERFLQNGQKALLELGWATYLKSLDYQPLFKKFLIEALPELNIKDCRYGEDFLDNAKNIEIKPDYYIDNEIIFQTYGSDTSGISSEENVGRFGKMWLFGMQDEFDGILFKRDEQETLLVKTGIICNILRKKIIEYNKKNPPILQPSQYTDAGILARLTEGRSVYGYKRKDGFQKIINFPVYSICNDYNPDKYIYLKEECRMIKINTDDIKCSCLNATIISDLKSFLNLAKRFVNCQRQRGRHFCSEELKAFHNAIREMDRYIDLK